MRLNFPGLCLAPAGAGNAVGLTAGSGDREVLRESYAARFARVGTGTCLYDVIDSALDTLLPDATLHPRLLDAYFLAPDRGTLQQLYTAKAIEHLFLFGPTLDAVESLPARRLYDHLVRILDDHDDVRRQEAMPLVFEAMKKGLSCLFEIPPVENAETVLHIRSLLDSGIPPDEVADGIRRSRHTAFIDDPGLARRVVQVMGEASEWVYGSSAPRDVNRRRLIDEVEAYLGCMVPGEQLSEAQLARLVALNQKDEWDRESLKSDIRIKSGKDFGEKVDDWGEVVGPECPQGCKTTLFRGFRSRKRPPEIWVRDLDPGKLAERRMAVIRRLPGIVHEVVHREDFLASPEAFADRELSEIGPGLDEFRWRMKNYDIDLFLISRRLGMSVPLYLKNIARWAYRKSLRDGGPNLRP